MAAEEAGKMQWHHGACGADGGRDECDWGWKPSANIVVGQLVVWQWGDEKTSRKNHDKWSEWQ